MRKLDFCMMTTQSDKGMRARPMSNNGEVEFDGDVWFFSAPKATGSFNGLLARWLPRIIV